MERQRKKREKNIAYKNWLNNGKLHDDWIYYVHLRNAYNRLLKDKKAQTTKNEIREAGNDQSKMWKCIKSIISNKSTIVSDEIIFEGNPCKNALNISENFNNFFVNSVNELNMKIPSATDNLNSIIGNNNTFKLRPIEIDDIIITAKALKKKVNRSEYCNSMVWSDAMDYIAHFMKSILNEVLLTGNFPIDWKISTVTPIPKITNTCKAEEFRPINTTATDEKLCEAIIKNQLTEYIETNEILATTQSAYRAQYSCETTINYLLRDWKDAIDKGNVVVVVFLDLKRAFETVDRERMLMKLKKYGITGTELELFKNYMSDRKQKVKFKEAISGETEVSIGLPQGTALSVILFILYINDIVNVPVHGSISLHADDTSIVVKDKDLNEAIRKMNEDLERIYNWLNVNKLLLNVSKTKWMSIIKNNNRNVYIRTNNVKIAGNEIEKVKSIKYLGILLDEKLNFDNHVDELVKNTSKKVNLLKRIPKKLTLDTRKTVYHSIISSNFDYCSTIYKNCTQEQLGKIQKI